MQIILFVWAFYLIIIKVLKETTEISPDALPHIKSDYIISPNYLYIIITDWDIY